MKDKKRVKEISVSKPEGLTYIETEDDRNNIVSARKVS
jgi:hypothetical protein